MLKCLAKLQSAVLFAFCLLLVFQTQPARSEPGVLYEISDVKVAIADNTLTYNISGISAPVYTVSERFSPFRVIVDIAGAFFAKDKSPSITNIPENRFVQLAVTDLKAQDPQLMRFEFTLADSHDYTVSAKGNNLEIKFFPATNTKKAATTTDGSTGDSVSLKDFKVTSTPTSTTISIVADAPVEKYTVDTISGGAGQAPRMYVDISNVKINELVPEKKIGTSVAKIRVSPKGKGTRIVFDSASSQLFKYSVTPSASGLDVVIDETPGGQALSQAKEQSTEKPEAGVDSTLDALIGSSQHLASSGPGKAAPSKKSPNAKASSLEKDFSFSGYNKQRISVDFYKIDIHNVFRLFRQITDLNIIVDEQVQGVLTLALNDVPWDFALDIILNLMDLKKEERFNTIVIYPSKKAFVWPTRAEDNLAFQADTKVIEKEALVIEKSAAQSKEIVEARELMDKAKTFEEQQAFEEAAGLYAKAFALWPQNSALANKLTTIYLVNLGQNANAVFIAKQSLQRDPGNTRAALYAGIGSANMQMTKEASEYFSQSISGTPPMKDALVSYAAFSENNGQNEAALKLLEKYQTYYGDNIDIMVAKGRVLDKIGRTKEATQQYKAILGSGFQVRPDLKKYIEGRIAAKDLH